MVDLTMAVPIIIALVQVAKVTGLPSRFAPILSVVLGLGVFYIGGDASVGDNLFEGLVAGLAASGLYSGVKASVL